MIFLDIKFSYLVLFEFKFSMLYSNDGWSLQGSSEDNPIKYLAWVFNGITYLNLS